MTLVARSSFKVSPDHGGVSETLRAALVREEEQLRALTQRLEETRRPKEYDAEVVLRNTTAALVGGRSVPSASLADGLGCVGALMNFLSTGRGASVTVSGRIYPHRVVRGLRGAVVDA